MNRFSRIRHHVSVEDVKKKHLEKIAVENFKKEEEVIVKKISNRFRRDWKKEIFEGMTTANIMTAPLAPAGDEVFFDTPTTSADVFDVAPARDPGFSYDAMVGTSIKSSGSGTGNNGGFDIGNHVAFDGSGSGGARWCVLKAVDTTEVDTMVVRAITGNGSNGGQTPDETLEDLILYYKTPEMFDYIPITYFPELTGSAFQGGNDIIIPVGHGLSGLQDYQIKIPSYARGKETRFLLYQVASTASGQDTYGLTNISFRRQTPVNVVVPLDSPEAISFINVGTNEGDPKKRKKRVDDMLSASDEYTTKQMGDQFPGQGGRIDGEDPFKSAPLTPDDVIERSPIGKGEVKKSFANFSTAAAAAQPEAEPESEPTTPSTQTTMNPTNDDGEEISVKEVGGKNSGIVQGADAANVDAQNDQDDAQDTTTTSDPEELEIPDPEEIKPDPEELENKTPDEQIELEIDKKQGVLDSQLSKLENQFNNATKDLSGFLNIIDLVTGPLQTVLNLAGSISSLVSRITGKNKPAWMAAKDDVLGKLNNNISIARSQLTGRIINGNLNMNEYDEFIKGVTIGDFADGVSLGKPNLGPAMINISSMRHEYQDDNIYVKDGKIYNNREEKATTLTAAHGGLSHHGEGYAQMIIPPDGGEPYIHYYDYGYNNLNNPEDIGGKGLSLAITSFLSDLSLFLSSVPGVGGTLADAFNKDEWMDGLRNTSSMEGWPPGIHGAVLIDFKVPVSKLSDDIQQMISNHPLSWTPERIANMSEEDYFDEIGKRSERFEDDDYILKALEDPDSGVDPEFLENYKRFDFYTQYDENTGTHPDAKEGTVQYDYDRAREELEKVQNSPEYSKASDAATKEWEDVSAEQDEKYAENEEKFGLKAQSDLYEKLVGPYYRAVQKAIRGGGSISKNSPTYQKMVNGYKEYEKQKKVMERKNQEGRDAIFDKYKKLAEEAYARMVDTFQVKELDDGTMGLVNGGDFKTKNGKVIPGMGTLSAKEKARFDEVRAEYEEVQDYLYSDAANYTDNLYKPFVLYDVKTQFGRYGISGDDWTPDKKGSGERSEDKPEQPKQPKPDPRSAYAGLDDPIIGLGAKDGDKVASNYPTASEQQILRNQLNSILKGQGKAAAKREQQRLLRMYGIYFPLAFESDGNVQVAHYQPRGNHLLEKYSNPYGGVTLYEKLKAKGFFNPKDIKPTFPENDPPEIDKKTGMHPNYGKQAKRYNKLDPISANAMPPTGDPEIDAVVDKQRTKPKTKKQKYLAKVSEGKKYNWREDFTNITTGNKVGQTFRHNPTGATFSTSGGLGGVESTSKTVTLDLGLGDFFTVDAPSYNQLGLAGFAKPILMKRKNTEDVNLRLNASQEFAKKANADVMMNARVEDSVDSAILSDIGYKSAEDILAEVGDVWTYDEYIEMMNAIGDRAAAKEEPIVKKILEYGPGGTKTGDVPISLTDAQEAITIASHKAMDELARAWELYNKIPEPQDGFGGGQGNPTNRRGSGFDTKGALDSSGYGMDPSRDTETEARPVKNDEDGKARVDKFNKEVENIQKFNDKVRENNINKIKEYIKSLKLNVTYEQLLKKGAIKTKGGIVAIDDAGKGNIRVGVFKGSDVYTKDKFVFHHGDKYTSKIESFNTEEGVKEIPTMPDVLQKWQSAQNRRNNVSKLVDISKQVFNQIKSDANPFRPLDTITKQAKINASKQISKLLMSTVKNSFGGKFSGMETPAAVMLAYNDFALNKARGKGSTTSNRLELNNIVSKSDNKIIKDKLRVNQVALSNYQKDPSNSLNRDQVILGAQTAFELAVNNNPQLRATFGGAAGTFPKAKIVGNNIVFEKSYGFQHSGSAQNINPVTRIAMDVLGLPPDTTGGSPLSPAPFAAAIGLLGDDIHARYYNTMSREERGGKPTSVVHSLYNVPDMHYKYTVPISELIKPSKSKTTSKTVNRIKSMAKTRRQSLSLDEPILKRKNKKS